MKENKFKAFIPTTDRIVYYNLEEYDRFMTIDQIDDYGWKYAKKCVLLAVSNIYTEDQQFIQQMESIIGNLTAWQEHSNENVTELSNGQN
ncbi:uncharacterized protein LOC113548248 [Rhopalosiphum maidis]|uniref:uncharacterized protein LOC113548248 n=1 Tax=Rhopalosiphum maidis TaxID=43146 RepID=UPI000EFF8237|nr:uncharacterized protein LOC113548248 [Rhopalosiphum maidis]